MIIRRGVLSLIILLVVSLASCIKDSHLPDKPVDLTIAKDMVQLQKMTLAIFLQIDDVLQHEDTLDFDGPGPDLTSCVKGSLFQSGEDLYHVQFLNTQCARLWNTVISGACTLREQGAGSTEPLKQSWRTDFQNLRYNQWNIEEGSIDHIAKTPNTFSLNAYFRIAYTTTTYKTFSFSAEFKLIDGASSVTVKDNKYLITPYYAAIGEVNHVTNFYSGNATDTLLLNVDCDGYPLSGSFLIDNNQNRLTGTIDFGSNTCDNIGTWIIQDKRHEIVFE